MNKVLITGAAGFIGFHLAQKFLKNGFEVVGLDNINDYYDIKLKTSRLNELGIVESELTNWGVKLKSQKYPKFSFYRLNLEEAKLLNSVFKNEKFDLVCNLAAQAGVRYSLENPNAYIQSNVVGFANILECCRNYCVKKLVYASSSSVYGENDNKMFSVNERVDKPISLYAATKKSNELMAYAYSHLYNLPTIGLRFFTVYGPWGRPDMAYYIFSEKIFKNEKIEVFNNGNMSRDFTYIDDIINGIHLLIESEKSYPKNDTPYALYNIGHGSPQSLMRFISIIEKSLNRTARINFMPMQAGDVSRTAADISSLEAIGYESKTSIEEGMNCFINWFNNYKSQVE